MCKKIITATAVAIFCVAAFAGIASEADAAQQNYMLYAEVIGDDFKVSEVYYFCFQSEANNEAYINAANAAFRDANVPLLFTLGKYGPSLSYNGSGSSSTFYSDGTALQKVTKGAEDYIGHTKTAAAVSNGWITAEQYNTLPEAEKEHWLSDPYMGYQKIPQCDAAVKDLKDYTLYTEVIGDDLRVSEVYFFNFRCEGTNETYIGAANAAFKGAGVPLLFKLGKYGPSLSYNGSGSSSTFYSDGAALQKVTKGAEDYIGHTKTAAAVNNGWITTEQYDALPEAEKEHWLSDPYMGYQKIPQCDAANKDLKDYILYAEVIGDDFKASESHYFYFKCEGTNETYIGAANAAFKGAGVPLLFKLGKYGPSLSYNGSGSSSTFYSDGAALQKVTKGAEDYIGHTKTAAAVNNGWITTEQYDALPASEKAYWLSDPYMGYQRIPQCDGATSEIKEYTVGIEIINDTTCASMGTETIMFRAEAEVGAWVAAFNDATAKLKSPFNTVNAAGKISIQYGANGNSACWVKEGKKWVAAEDTAKQYISGDLLCFEVNSGYIGKDKYNSLSDEEKSSWKSSGMDYPGYEYMRIGFIQLGEPEDEGSNLLLYIGIAVVAIIVIAIVAIVLMKKGKSPA